MKRVLALILALLLVLSLVACVDKDDNNKKDSSSATDKENSSIKDLIRDNYPEEAKIVLNRKIFGFKNAYPNLYTGANPNINETISYVEDWNFGQILNDENYKKIEWEVTNDDDIVRILFTGKSIAYNGAIVTVEFLSLPGDDLCIAGGFLAEFKNMNTEIWYSDYVDQGLDDTDAAVAADIAISCMLATYSEAAMTNVYEYYEDQADECMAEDDFDGAIAYYEKAYIYGDKLLAAYYAKAEECLANDNFEDAFFYFIDAGNYKDAAVRKLEVRYKTGQEHEKDGKYEEAVICYAEAGDYSNAREKHKECCYKQAEIDLKNKNYVGAIIYFESAVNYKDAPEKYKEACYLYADQQLLIGDVDTASSYFAKAGDYKDAAKRMQQYFYEHGNEYLVTKNYLNAIDCFKHILDYSDSADKYKEANYLYGEELLSEGNVETAKKYFYEAKGYKDAEERVLRYYYETGTTLLESGEYLSAAEQFILADTYSDAKTMESECYYQYGKQQLELNYVSNATEYFSLCRGYKDTDDILLGYYYSEASKSVDVLMKVFSREILDITEKKAYEDAKNKLQLCEGYKDSGLLLRIVEKLYYVCEEMQFESKFEASFYHMKASFSGENVYITQPDFISGTTCTLSMTHNVNDNTFSADITHMFSAITGETKVLAALLTLFTDIENTDDFITLFKDTSNWVVSGETKTFSISYGGYSIVVQVKPEAYGYTDCHISATK
jgi:tetratricopeptide (TPR) repeat protein